MKNLINKSWAIFLGVVILVSCTKNFEEINKDPNSPSVDLAAPDMLLANAIETMTDRVHETFLGEEMGNCWVQHEAKVQYTDEDRYIPRVTVINNTWTSFFASSGQDVVTLYKIGVDRDMPNYQGVALVLKAYISSVLTDLFGDIPYTEAWSAAAEDGGVVSPAYDSQQEVYTDLISILEQANTLLDPDGQPISGDILYNGDILKWKKFANSLKMRLLIRISDRQDPSSAIQTMVNDPGTYPMFESNDDDAQLNYLGAAPNNNPRHENRKTRDDHRVSKTITDFMWTQSSYVDWRICVFADLSANGDFEGIPNGLTSAEAADYNGGGLKMSKIGSYFSQATTPGVLMSYSEVLFCYAEAAFKGWIPGGATAAGTYYEQAIHANYNHYGQDLVDIVDAYFSMGMTADELADDFLVNEDHAWNDAEGIRLIGEEKWITLFDQGLEAWAEWRRLDYPVLVPGPSAVLSEVPKRVYYPSDESARNGTNWAAAKSAQGITSDSDLLTKVWWDVN
ncbi:MAG TPA: SusD/RagB family nutrient-binding outer membrane lipoprotein [Cyclobacteriaceae bacterium]|nr:SusD/RagB family nutrient-binding outer membrane lipoprotein [Cyclobacteriaceae bacterium]